MPCTFGFCDDCGQKLDDAMICSVVKEAYPDRPTEECYSDPDAPVSGFVQGQRDGWILFLYPGRLIGDMLALIPGGAQGSLYGRSYLPE